MQVDGHPEFLTGLNMIRDMPHKRSSHRKGRPKPSSLPPASSLHVAVEGFGMFCTVFRPDVLDPLPQMPTMSKVRRRKFSAMRVAPSSLTVR